MCMFSLSFVESVCVCVCLCAWITKIILVFYSLIWDFTNLQSKKKIANNVSVSRVTEFVREFMGFFCCSFSKDIERGENTWENDSWTIKSISWSMILKLQIVFWNKNRVIASIASGHTQNKQQTSRPNRFALMQLVRA